MQKFGTLRQPLLWFWIAVVRKQEKKRKNFRSRRWGSSLPGLRTRDPSLSPPSTWAEIFRRTCLQSHFFEISPFSGQNGVILGGPWNNFYWNPAIFVSKERMQKFETLRQPLLWFWIAVVTRKEKKRKKRLIPKISAHADGGPRSPSAHAWRSACPPIDTSGIPELFFGLES